LFVFSGIFPPGYHQILIYDPQQERLFCKDFVVQHNHKDQFPEIPKNNKFQMIKTKIIPNVWAKFK